ncbi:glycosyltransferase family 4 protein [Sulfitobacter sp. 1A13191]|uniref:glycosyltransferase family 4 protein n=1 Tax=Sulfitobacter sp. 1A13191 TaxID=3368589 RepID=UPI0037465415
MKKVVLICNSDGALANFRAPLIRALVHAGHEVVTISPRSFYFDALKEMGARTIEIEFSRHSASILRNLVLLRDLREILRREQPDVVHSFTHKAVIFGSFAARLAGVKKILATVTGLGTLFVPAGYRTRLLRQALVWQYRLLLPRHAKVLFQNPDDKQEMESLGAVVPSQSVLTNGSGIDLAEFSLPNRETTARARRMLAAEIGQNLEGKIVAIFPARGVPEKGFEDFYAAAGQLAKRLSDEYVFCHMGLVDTAAVGAFDAKQVTNFARKHGVHYLGYKTNPRDYLTAADILVLPSYYREGVPRSLIEGLALGKAIVSTDMPGCRETVLDGQNGYFCPARDRDGLAEVIAKIDSDFLVRACAHSRRLCEKKFDVRKLNALTFDLYGFPQPTELVQHSPQRMDLSP